VANGGGCGESACGVNLGEPSPVDMVDDVASVPSGWDGGKGGAGIEGGGGGGGSGHDEKDSIFTGSAPGSDGISSSGSMRRAIQR
jgi:hypothetical protein